MITPSSAATPLPPRKPAKRVKVWPSTAAEPVKIPARWMSLMKRSGKKDGIKATASHPFEISTTATTSAGPTPRTR